MMPIKHKQDWFELANSPVGDERLLALNTAINHASNYQVEILFWYLQAEMPIEPERRLYEALSKEYKELVDKNRSNVPYRFQASNYEKDQEAWIRLAGSDDAENRMLALEISSGDAEHYQEFLLRWLIINKMVLPKNFKAYWRMYDLLNEKSKKALELRFAFDRDIPVRFGNLQAFDDFAEPESAMRLATIYLLEHSSKFSKLEFVRYYRSFHSPSLRGAKEAADAAGFW